MMTPWRKKKLIRKINGDFGKEPEKDYYPGDMEWIRTYSDACQANKKDLFYVDEEGETAYDYIHGYIKDEEAASWLKKAMEDAGKQSR